MLAAESSSDTLHSYMINEPSREEAPVIELQ